MDGQQLKNTDTYTYLRSVLCGDGQLNREISSHISKASISLGHLYHLVWNSHDIKMITEISVYRAVVLNYITVWC